MKSQGEEAKEKERSKGPLSNRAKKSEVGKPTGRTWEGVRSEKKGSSGGRDRNFMLKG